MTETAIEAATDETVADQVVEAPPVTVEVNHRGGRADLMAVHVGGQQQFGIVAVDLHANANDAADVVVTMTGVDGAQSTVRVTRLDIVGELVEP